MLNFGNLASSASSSGVFAEKAILAIPNNIKI